MITKYYIYDTNNHETKSAICKFSNLKLLVILKTINKWKQIIRKPIVWSREIAKQHSKQVIFFEKYKGRQNVMMLSLKIGRTTGDPNKTASDQSSVDNWFFSKVKRIKMYL